MKKIYIALTVLVTVVLSSCVREKSFGGAVLGENDIAFSLKSAPATRSLANAEPAVTTYEFKAPSVGKILYMDEELTTIDDLYQTVPGTKGTPAYTENVAELYGSFNGIAKTLSNSLQISDGQFTADGNVWTRRFGDDPWGSNDELYFFLRMPGTQGGVTSEYTYTVAGTDGASSTIAFDYTSPAKATDQQDILFAGRPVSKEEAKSESGAPVLFHHALTGVKFRMGNELDLTDATKTRTYITKVEFIGLKNSGTCTITPTNENGDYVDITDNHSSAGAVSWAFAATPSRTTAAAPIYQEFGDNVLIDYTGGSTFPASFYSDPETTNGKSGLDKNLNDASASMTFWLIPQVLDENVKIKVTVKIVADGDVNLGPSGTGNECVLELGAKQTGKEWKAGELRTYTLKPDVVGIKINDEMTNSNTVKENVVIKNLGNVKEYVRVNIIANWVGKVQTDEGVYNTEDSVLMGYTDAEQDPDTHEYLHYTLVPTWNDKDFEWNGDTKRYTTPGYPTDGYGTFIGLPAKGSKTAPGPAVGNWIRHDKYYYYMLPIGPGDTVYPSTDPLFEKYIVGPSPDFWIADGTGVRRLAGDVHLVMDIMVQAIRVPLNDNGEPTKTYAQAWADELGVSVTGLNDL